MTAAMSGLSEKLLQRMQRPMETYLQPSAPCRLLSGRTAFGLENCPSIPSTAQFRRPGRGMGRRRQTHRRTGPGDPGRLTVFDLEEANSATPQYGSAKDPLNMVGFVAAGMLRGDQPVVHVEQLSELEPDNSCVLDVVTRPRSFRQDISRGPSTCRSTSCGIAWQNCPATGR